MNFQLSAQTYDPAVGNIKKKQNTSNKGPKKLNETREDVDDGHESVKIIRALQEAGLWQVRPKGSTQKNW